MNYFSSVITWVTSHNEKDTAFKSNEVKLMKHAIFKNPVYIPKQAPPIDPQQFTSSIRFLSALNPPPFVLIVAFIERLLNYGKTQ